MGLEKRHDATIAGDADGERLFWNQASNVFSFVPCWGDGEALDDDTLEALNAAMWRSAVAFEWSKGDVLCCDNERVLHARMSFEHGAEPRKLCVGFSAT